MHSTPTTRLIPHASSALWFKELFNGFSTANSLLYASDATEPLKMLKSEDIELADAQVAKPGADGSLAPRGVAFWLLGKKQDFTRPTTSTLLHEALDAIAHWASSVSNVLRVSATFGVDVDFILQQVGLAQNLEDGEMAILLRWHDGTSVQTVLRILDFSSALAIGGCSLLSAIQATVIRLAGANDIELPPQCFKPVRDPAPPNAFLFYQHKVSTSFFGLLKGEPYVPECAASLTPIGAFVRVASREVLASGEASNHQSSFHGALLCSIQHLDAARKFVSEGGDSLRFPTTEAELDLKLHICAAQVERVHFGGRVSVYGTMGVCGNSISPPMSCAWISRPAIRPIDQDLLQHFAVLPCSKQSLLPGRSELVPSFSAFWKENVNDIFLNLEKTPSSDKVLKATPTPPPVEKELDLETSWLLALLNLDLKSQRTSVGEAYCYLARHRNFNAKGSNVVLDQLKVALTALGVCAPLADASRLASKAMREVVLVDNAITYTSNDDMLRRLCDVALATANTGSAANKRQKTLEKQEGENARDAAMATERMKSLLASLGVRRQTEITVMAATVGEAVTDLIQIVADAAGNQAITSNRHRATMSTALSSVRSLKRVVCSEALMRGIAKALGVALSVAARSATHPIFILQACKKSSFAPRLLRVVTDTGEVVSSPFDALMSAPANVELLMLQRLNATKVRVASTKLEKGVN